jgi:sulfite exporter TauE/SafE
MTLFFSLLPLYLFGNLHCMGMCGPLVMLLGQHRYRLFYFLGRLFSFSLAGLVAGELGAVLHIFLKQYYLAEIISLLCGMLIIGWGIQKIIGRKRISLNFSHQYSPISALHHWISTLLLKDRGWATFLFGFFTIALPCGQTLVVFSACALVGNAWIGLGNGFAFALLTTPSLVIAMHTLTLFKNFKQYDRAIIGGCSIFVGLLACCRGLAEMGWINHWILNHDAPTLYHLVIF